MNEAGAIAITFFSVLIPLITAILSVIVKYTKSDKVRQDALKVNFWVEQVAKYVKQAEFLINKSGAEKKDFVKANVNSESLKNHIKYDDKKVDELIENTVKVLNTNKTKPAPLTPPVKIEPVADALVKYTNNGEEHAVN